MAINFKLARRGSVPLMDDDPMGRTWVGWDEDATLDEIWDVNRGYWRLAESRLKTQRLATMSYEGVIRLVAEIHGHALVLDDKYKILEGRRLPLDHPVSRALVGMPLTGDRNPVSYFSTAAEEEELMRFAKSFLLTCNPARFDLYAGTAQEMQTQIAAGVEPISAWATGPRTSGIQPGDRCYLLQQGQWTRGIVASGTAVSEIFRDEHFDSFSAGPASYVSIAWTAVVDEEVALPTEELQHVLPDQPWTPRASGTVIHPEIASELADLWARHVGDAVITGGAPDPREPAGQGRVMDVDLRKQIEDAAQNRLMKHFSTDGWDVEDHRHVGPFDAVATKGRRKVYLEAKGTTQPGDSVIVTRKEVADAERHRGSCFLGIVCNLALDDEGNVDPSSGDFWVGPFDPAAGNLSAISYDFRPWWTGFTKE